VNVDLIVGIVIAIFVADFILALYRSVKGRITPFDLFNSFILTISGFAIAVTLLLQAEPSILCGTCYTFKYGRQATVILGALILPILAFLINLVSIYVPIREALRELVKRIREEGAE